MGLWGQLTNNRKNLEDPGKRRGDIDHSQNPPPPPAAAPTEYAIDPKGMGAPDAGIGERFDHPSDKAYQTRQNRINRDLADIGGDAKRVVDLIRKHNGGGLPTSNRGNASDQALFEAFAGHIERPPTTPEGRDAAAQNYADRLKAALENQDTRPKTPAGTHPDAAQHVSPMELGEVMRLCYPNMNNPFAKQTKNPSCSR